MRISNAYPSTYLKAADLQDRNVTVIIDKIVMEDIGGDHKPVMYFQGKEKGLVLNKTNANNISYAYGDETDDWPGRELVLYPTIVDFQGRSVDAIRVKVPAKRAAAASPAAPPQHDRPARSPAEMDDEIPF